MTSHVIIMRSFFRCTVITNDGYFVLLPDGTVPPLHITEHSDVSIAYDLCTCTYISFSFSSFSPPV